jgi:transcriptional regulator with XRE-family HTH domain
MSHEVDMTEDEPMCQLVNRERCSGSEFLRLLMERTGNGDKISIRELANFAGVSHGTIHNLLTGQKEELPHRNAYLLAQRLGVDHDLIWDLIGRSTSAIQADQAPTAAVPA